MIKVITGPMFAGKSEYLITEYMFLQSNYPNNKIQAFKPSKDTRTKTRIKSRKFSTTIPAEVVHNFKEIVNRITPDTSDIFIDEVQFIEGDVVELKKLSVYENKNFIIGGLSMTAELKPFGAMPNILAIADEVVHIKADCECGEKAELTYCKVKKQGDILVGDQAEYKPLCRNCYIKYNREG